MGGRLLAWEAERRFIQERQILARLDHPNIVRMLDGGLDNGRRYLVMEFVRGEPLTSYCLQRNLPLAARLRLFCDVAAAVQCAHQNLIIHRDLKASNLLVTEEGVVKVLDFGIAQLLDAGVDAPAGQTGLNPWTLSSASPEQIMGAPLTVAADIYSLGLLLYELLTGVNPQFSPGERADETIARICERDPKPPSSSIHRAVPRDLDAIVLRALAKTPQQRYGSAEEFRADVQRFLEGRTVLAQPPSTAYRFRRWIGRNKLLSAVSAALILAVLAGLGAFAWQARVAERQRALAERRFNEARRLIRTVIHDIQPKMGAIAGTTTLRKELIDKTLVYLERLAADGAGNAELMRELVTSYLELAKIQGMPQDANLGDAVAAGRALERALRLTEALLLEDANDPATLEVAALCYRQSAFALQSQNRQRAAEHAQRALELSEKLAGLKPADTRARGTLADSLLAAAIIQGSLPKYQQALVVYRSLPLPDSNPALLRNTALIHKYLSGWYLSADELPKRDPHKALQHA